MVKNQTSVLYCEEGFSEPLRKEHTKQFPGLWRSALSAIWSRQKTQLGLKHRGHVVFPQPPGVLLSHAGLSVKEEQVLSKEQPEGPVAIWSTRSGHQNLDLIISGIHVVITRLLNNAIFAFFSPLKCQSTSLHLPTSWTLCDICGLRVPPLELTMSFWRSLQGSGIPKALFLNLARRFSIRYIFLNESGKLVNKDKLPFQGS